MPSILGARNLINFITDDIREKCIPIKYLHTNGRTAFGYDAELIPLICEVYLKAHEKKQTVTSQEKIVIRAGIIVRTLARIGITALIDEATGYQYDREKQELQKILAAYISEEYLRWQKRFPRKFYQEIFRLLGWSYNPLSVSRPSYLGKFTNKYVYKQMPSGVLDELKKKNPIIEEGYRKHRHHQFLTESIGIPHLDKHITKLITIMELSQTMGDFKNNFNKIFNKKEISRQRNSSIDYIEL